MERFQILFEHSACFFMFFLMLWISRVHKSHRIFIEPGLPAENPGNLIGLQIITLLWFGIVPAFIFKQSFFTVVFGDAPISLMKLTLVMMLAIFAVMIALKQSRLTVSIMNSKFFDAFSFRTIQLYLVLRIGALVAYEIWFRGYLLSDLNVLLGTPMAILLNVTIYALAHVFSSRKELIACIPFGFMLCILTIYMQAAWPAILIHLAFSMAYELSLISLIFKPLKNIL